MTLLSSAKHDVDQYKDYHRRGGSVVHVGCSSRMREIGVQLPVGTHLSREIR